MTRFGSQLSCIAARPARETDIPYLAHLMAVAAIVLEHGADEDTAIAALLHDAVEDPGGAATAELIRSRFGDAVADHVLHCSDSVPSEAEAKPPWRERKTAYLQRLAHAGAEVALISAADKLHNLTATIRDLRTEGPQTLTRFAEPDALVWYYSAVADALTPHAERAPVAELKIRIAELGELLD